MTRTTATIYTAPTNALAEWLDAFILAAVCAHYTSWDARGRTGREPAVTVALMLGDVRQSSMPEDLRWTVREKQGRMVRASMERLTRYGALVRTTGLGESGREARMYEPGPDADATALCLMDGTADDIARRMRAEDVGRSNAYACIDQWDDTRHHESREDAVMSYEQNVTDTVCEYGLGRRGADIASDAFTAVLTAAGWTFE